MYGDDTKPRKPRLPHLFPILFLIMPLSTEAQREEKLIAKQAAADEKVRDQRLVRRRSAYSAP